MKESRQSAVGSKPGTTDYRTTDNQETDKAVSFQLSALSVEIRKKEHRAKRAQY